MKALQGRYGERRGDCPFYRGGSAPLPASAQPPGTIPGWHFWQPETPESTLSELAALVLHLLELHQASMREAERQRRARTWEARLSGFKFRLCPVSGSGPSGSQGHSLPPDLLTSTSLPFSADVISGMSSKCLQLGLEQNVEMASSPVMERLGLQHVDFPEVWQL